MVNVICHPSTLYLKDGARAMAMKRPRSGSFGDPMHDGFGSDDLTCEGDREDLMATHASPQKRQSRRVPRCQRVVISSAFPGNEIFRFRRREGTRWPSSRCGCAAPSQWASSPRVCFGWRRTACRPDTATPPHDPSAGWRGNELRRPFRAAVVLRELLRGERRSEVRELRAQERHDPLPLRGGMLPRAAPAAVAVDEAHRPWAS